MKIDFSGITRQTRDERELLEECFSEVLDSANFISGKYVKNFESQIGDYFNSRHVIATSSGTQSLELIMKYLHTKGHSRVGTVANAGGYSSLAALNVGMKVVLIDCEIESGQMSFEDLKMKHELSNFSVLVYTHLYGNYLCLDEILEFCDKYKIVLVEDCAQAFGLTANGKRAGTFGKFSAFSFYPTKNLGAIGDSGAVLVKEKNDHLALRNLREYGWSEKYRVDLYGGTNARMDEIQACVLSKRLLKLEQWNDKRLEILKKYQNSIDPSIGYFPKYDKSIAHLAVIITTNLEQVKNLLKNKEIAFGFHYPIPDSKQLAWRNIFEISNVPNAENLCSRVISIPCYPQMKSEEIEYVAEILNTKLN